ncbi:hypothetical protein [Amycolatopsis jejuensis]|uniref:hypothetical protein n=1 Tax=Amycolatopsis jejuensis TaxID=330084 RepID=UPI00068ABA48|nr:hypothetical protein [Amycolatopsis jejuensis]
MAEARFEMVHISPEQLRGRGYSGAAGNIVWRFLSANNRSLAQSVNSFPDAASCADAVRVLRAGLAVAEVVTVRDTGGKWRWQVRIGGTAVGVSARSYLRRLHAVYSGNSFRELAEHSSAGSAVRVRP